MIIPFFYLLVFRHHCPNRPFGKKIIKKEQKRHNFFVIKIKYKIYLFLIKNLFQPNR
ncbi:hypothetical protein J525_3515 [Acinetobacter sp. 21871]|nr:hypothetical protein J525_3515 [Acinetobacter sp. 21871]